MIVPVAGGTLQKAYNRGAAATQQVVLLDSTRNYVEWRRNALGNVLTDAVIATRFGNATAAAAGAQQRSPLAVLQGSAWNTGAAASRAVEFGEQVVPVQAASNAAIQTASSKVWAVQVGGGGWGAIAELAGDGQLRAGAGTAALPGQSFITASDMGGRRASATQYGFSTAGVSRYTLDSTRLDSQVPIGVREGSATLVAGFPLQVVTSNPEGGLLAKSEDGTNGYGRTQVRNNIDDATSTISYGDAVAGSIFGLNQARMQGVLAGGTGLAIGTLAATPVHLGVNQEGSLRCVAGNIWALSARPFSRARGASIASATTITWGTDGDSYPISGTATIQGAVTANWQAGTRKRMEFTSTAQVTHNSGAPGTGAVAFLLEGSLSFAAVAGATLDVEYDGTNWKEVDRRFP